MASPGPFESFTPFEPSKTSRAVLEAIQRANKLVTIAPERQSLMPNKSHASKSGRPPCGNDTGRQPGLAAEPAVYGIDEGSAVELAFAALDWAAFVYGFTQSRG
jgi:hypothetical protein